MMELIENTRSNVLAFLSSAFGKRRFKAVTEVLSYFQFSLLITYDSMRKKVAHDKGAPGGGVLPFMGHIGICRCEGYGFQADYSSIWYINQSVWV